MIWTAGFDVLYACQDYDYDRTGGLAIDTGEIWDQKCAVDRAAVSFSGLYRASTTLSRDRPRWFALAGVLAVGVLFIYQHTLVKANDLSRMNAAFFTTNAFVSVILLATFGGAVFIEGFR